MLAMTNTSRRFASLTEYIAVSGRKKYHVAKELGVSTYQMSALLYPDRYSIQVDAALAAKIATLLNQPTAHVRKLYPRKAVA